MNRIGALRASMGSPSTGLAGLLILALVAGAGGVSAAFGNMTVQLMALALLMAHTSAITGFFRAGPRALMVIVAASLSVPLLQLVPLPPALWGDLPGRTMLAQSLDLAGGQGWYPLSLSPARTVMAFLGLIAPFAIVAIGCGLPAHRLVMLQRTIIWVGLGIGLFGTTHLIDERWGDLYASVSAMPGVLVGTFADRNAASLFLDCCLLLLVGLPAAPPDGRALALRLAGGIFLLVCVLLTGSRSGIALLALPAALLICRVLRARGVRLGLSGAIAVAVLVASAGAAIVSSGRVQSTVARLEQGDDGMRAEMREDARFAAARYWPLGAGMGSFDEVFQIDESLEYVSPRRAGRAHMDYLELAIEAGLAGIGLAAAWLAWALWMSWRALRQPGAWPARAAGLMVVSIAAQSVVSFPLRNQAMLCLAALAMVLLARSPVTAAVRAGQDN